jgi:hypothetical protein
MNNSVAASVWTVHGSTISCFLNLGLLAYFGCGEELSQVQIGKVLLLSYFGSVAFVLWQLVYLVKQVAT